jgi:hypothetical protein
MTNKILVKICRYETMLKIGKSGSAKQARRNKLVLYKGIGPPHECAITLKVSSQYNANHAGTLQTFGFVCNHPASPFATFTTSEAPSYLAWMSVAYESCFTRAARIKVNVINSTVADSIQIVIAKDGNLTGTHTINSLGEMRDAHSRLVGYYTGGSNQAVLNSQFSPMGDMGIASNSPDNISVVGAAPPNPYNWILGMQSIAGGTGNVAIRVEIEYDLEFIQLVSPAPI